MKIVTLWYKFDNEKNKWVYNHLLEKLTFDKKPIPKFEKQIVWNNYKWKKVFALLNKKRKVINLFKVYK